MSSRSCSDGCRGSRYASPAGCSLAAAIWSPSEISGDPPSRPSPEAIPRHPFALISPASPPWLAYGQALGRVLVVLAPTTGTAVRIVPSRNSPRYACMRAAHAVRRDGVLDRPHPRGRRRTLVAAHPPGRLGGHHPL